MELMQANREWSTRPTDQRFLSLTDLHTHVSNEHNTSVQGIIKLRELEARPCESVEPTLILDESGNPLLNSNGEEQYKVHSTGKELEFVNTNSGNRAAISNYAFNQMCVKADIPAGYVERLPAKLASLNINHGLASATNEDVSLLISKYEGNGRYIRAVLGPKYERVWNSQVTGMMVDRFGDGVTGDWKVPGEFGKDVPITLANTTIFGSPKDIFVFLCDEKNRIEIPNRRDGKPGSLARGFFVWNSEVGAQTLGIATFLFDYACSNRIVWGATEYKELRLKHTKTIGDRWLEEFSPMLTKYQNEVASNTEQLLITAQGMRISDKSDATERNEDVGKFIKSKLGIKPQVTNKLVEQIMSAHIKAEQRPIETLWDIVTGVTEHAKTIQFQDERVSLERAGGKLLDLVAN